MSSSQKNIVLALRHRPFVLSRSFLQAVSIEEAGNGGPTSQTPSGVFDERAFAKTADELSDFEITPTIVPEAETVCNRPVNFAMEGDRAIQQDVSFNEYFKNIINLPPSRQTSLEKIAESSQCSEENPLHEVNILMQQDQSLPPVKRRRKQVPVPPEKRNEAYYRYRKKNTETARLFRRHQKAAKITRKQKLDALRKRHNELLEECEALQTEKNVLQQQLHARTVTFQP